MNRPKPLRNAPSEATQELQALDVLEIVETMDPKPGTFLRRPFPSSASIAPVGLDLPSSRAVADEEASATGTVLVPVRRRYLGGVVVAAVLGCALILVAAGIGRFGNANAHASTAADPTVAPEPGTTAGTPPAPQAVVPLPAAPQSGHPAPSVDDSATPPADRSSAGTIRLDRPATPGRVWLDGKKLSSSSALVSCGTHQIKVGRGRAHSVDVPCGGEVGVAK